MPTAERHLDLPSQCTRRLTFRGSQGSTASEVVCDLACGFDVFDCCAQAHLLSRVMLNLLLNEYEASQGLDTNVAAE